MNRVSSRVVRILERHANVNYHVEEMKPVQVGNSGSGAAVERTPVGHGEKYVVVARIREAGAPTAEGRSRNASGGILPSANRAVQT